MSNSLLTISQITKESLRELKNQLVLASKINRQYSDQFANKSAKIGNVINIRKPLRYAVSDGANLVVQDSADQSVALTLDQRKHVGMQFSMQDMTLSIDEFRGRYIKPAITALANQIDFAVGGMYKSVWNSVGVAGTVPATLAVALAAGQKLDENGCPADGDRSLVLNPAGQAGLVGGLSTLFQSASELDKQYKKGRMGEAAGFTWYMGQNINTHTVGPLGGTPLVNGNATDVTSSLSTKGWTSAAASRLKKGDVLTLAGVNAVNPQSKADTGSLMQFVVTSDFSSDGSGNGSVGISPTITLAGPYQNVTALPIDGAAIKIFDQVSTSASKVTPANLAFHKDAFVMGMVDLELPGGVDMAARAVDPDAGLSIRIVRDYDINTDNMPCRLDVLYGLLAVYPELACRLQG